MPQRSEPGSQREGGGEAGSNGQKPPSPLQRLLQTLGAAGGDEKEPRGQGAVISPVSIEKLIEVLGESPLGTEEEEEAARTVDAKAGETLRIVHRLARRFIDLYARDGLGRIYHPLYSRSTVEARLGLLSQMLASTIREIWEDVAQQYHSSKLSPQDFNRYVHEARQATKLAFLVLVEVYNELATLYYINAPPKMRPPLVNASLGFELIK